MITLQDLFAIGYVSKTHGIKGELNIQLDTDFNPEDFNFLFFELDETYIPFRIESSRGNGAANRLVKIKDIDNIEEAKTFVGKTVYVQKSELAEHPLYEAGMEDEEGLYLSDLVGFELLDENDREVGRIIGYNDETLNVLIEIERTDGNRVFVPFVEDWILSLDPEKRKIRMDLPAGIL